MCDVSNDKIKLIRPPASAFFAVNTYRARCSNVSFGRVQISVTVHTVIRQDMKTNLQHFTTRPDGGHVMMSAAMRMRVCRGNNSLLGTKIINVYLTLEHRIP